MSSRNPLAFTQPWNKLHFKWRSRRGSDEWRRARHDVCPGDVFNGRRVRLSTGQSCWRVHSSGRHEVSEDGLTTNNTCLCSDCLNSLPNIQQTVTSTLLRAPVSRIYKLRKETHRLQRNVDELLELAPDEMFKYVLRRKSCTFSTVSTWVVYC